MHWLERKFRRHITIGRMTIYGFNAMHVAVNVWTKRWGYICFHPPMKVFGAWWPWYFYVSPNATPSCATFGIGPGYREERESKGATRRRRERWGHNFNTDLLYDELRASSVERD